MHLPQAKGNTIIMGTTPYPDERSLKLAGRRGVVLTASHFEIVGFNAFAWSQAFGRESTALWDWGKHPGEPEKVGTNAVLAPARMHAAQARPIAYLQTQP